MECTVWCDGKKLGSGYEPVEVVIKAGLNRIGEATVKFDAGTKGGAAFDKGDGQLIKPGNTIRLDAGEAGQERPLFEGLIVGLRILTGEDGGPYMVVECRDVAFAASQECKNRVFEKKTDDEMIHEALSGYGTVEVDATRGRYPSMVQYYCSDWDFALARAEASGLFIATSGNKIAVKKPAVYASPAIALTWGDNITEFDMELSASGQFERVEAVSWSPNKQKAVKVLGTASGLNKQGDMQPGNMGAGKSLLLQTDAPIDENALKQWADGMALRAGLARYKGSVGFRGSASVVPGCTVELNGMGKLFDGTMFVGRVEHVIRNNEWTTRAEAGVESVRCGMAEGLSAVAGVGGLHTAVVTKPDGDPEEQFRVQVELPWMEGLPKRLWARLATPSAGKGVGSMFVPEAGDEVVVGFVDGNPSHPVIVGSVWSSSHKPPYGPDARNEKKAFVSREKLRVEFDEGKKAITISTPGKNSVEISDDNKRIRLVDQHNNEIVMDSNGIVISSAKEITLKAKGSITLDSSLNIDVKTKSNVAIEGMKVNVQGKTEAIVKGNAKAELSSSGQTVVKGGMVMIN